VVLEDVGGPAKSAFRKRTGQSRGGDSVPRARMPVSQRASMFWLQKDVDVRSKNLSRRLADPCRPRIAPVVSNVVIQSVLSAVLRVISIRHLERCCDTLGPFAVIAGEMVPIRKETYHIADAAYSWTDDAVRVSCQPHGNCGAFVPRDDQRELECYCSQSLLRPDTSRGSHAGASDQGNSCVRVQRNGTSISHRL
jgi:hypothetical protein